MVQIPLAERIRPKTLDEYIGQSHLVGPNGAIRFQINNGNLPSIIFWGPPGTGKTTLAQIIAQSSERPFYNLSAINSGVKDVRDVLEKAKKSKGLFTATNPILFIDEIHRFNKSQQDSLLGAVERGMVTLIGATTENPSFEVIPALLSRCQIYTLNAFGKSELTQLLYRALNIDESFSKKDIELKETEALIRVSGGDGRKILNLLELVVESSRESPVIITDSMVLEKAQKNTVLYDKNGEQHYNIISAFIKSIRGSDPNAAVYWLAYMVEAGEDVKFIARRMLILASEDIGNANPTALVMANATFQAVNTIGYPEARIILSQCATYLACSPKSNAAYKAIKTAQQLVHSEGPPNVPVHLRNAPTKMMKEMGYGKDYSYSHDNDHNFVDQEYMPEALSAKKIYDPGNNPREQKMREFLKIRWNGKYGY